MSASQTTIRGKISYRADVNHNLQRTYRHKPTFPWQQLRLSYFHLHQKYIRDSWLIP